MGRTTSRRAANAALASIIDNTLRADADAALNSQEDPTVDEPTTTPVVDAPQTPETIEQIAESVEQIAEQALADIGFPVSDDELNAAYVTGANEENVVEIALAMRNGTPDPTENAPAAQDDDDLAFAMQGVGEPFDTGEPETEAPKTAGGPKVVAVEDLRSLLWLTSQAADAILVLVPEGLVAATINGGERTKAWVKMPAGVADLAPLAEAVAKAQSGLESSLITEEDKEAKAAIRYAIKNLKSLAGYIGRAPKDLERQAAKVVADQKKREDAKVAKEAARVARELAKAAQETEAAPAAA
jgi:hypothetical protein